MFKISDFTLEKHNKYLYPLFAIISFSTWYFKVPEYHNLILYLVFFLVLVLLRAKNLTLVIFLLFVALSNRTPSINPGPHGTNTLLYQIVFFVFAIYFITKMIINKSFPKGKLIFIMGLLLSYLVLTFIWSPNILGGLSELGYVIQGYFVYLVIRLDKNEKISFYSLSWILSLLLLVLSLEFFVITYKIFPFEGKAPLMQLWANPNIIAAIFGISFVPSLYKYFSKEKNKKVFYYLPVEILVLYSIYVTKSEGLYAALIVGVLFGIVYMFIKNRKLLYILSVTGISTFILFLVAVILLKDKYPEFYIKLDHFSTSRLQIYTIAVNQFKNPLVLLFGRGSGSAETILRLNGFSNFYFHSWVFHITVQRGLLTLAGIFYMYYLISKILIGSNNPFKIFVTIGIIIYIAHCLIDVGFEYAFLGVYVYMLVGLIENDNEQVYLKVLVYKN